MAALPRPVTGMARREGYGRGTHVIAGGALAVATPEDLAREVLARFSAPDYEPPILPSVAMQLLELSRKSSTSFKDVERLLEQEPLLTGRVVRIAQSAAYATREPVRNLEQAISRLGLRTLTDLFLQVSIGAKIFRAPGFEKPMDRLRKHSILAAHLSRELTRMLGAADDEAFLAGLLHDSGIAAMLILAADFCAKKADPDLEHIWNAILEAHLRCIEVLAKSWKLSPELTETLVRHHAPFVDGKPHRRAALLCVADSLAGELLPVGDERDDSAAEARRALGLSDPDLERLRTLAHHIEKSLA